MTLFFRKSYETNRHDMWTALILNFTSDDSYKNYTTLDI